MIDMNDKVIVSIEPEKDRYFSIYTVVKEGQNIEELIDKADHLYTNFPEYNRKHACMTFREYLKREREFYTSSCHSISEAEYYDMLEVLPPIYIENCWYTDGYKISEYKILNAFALREALSGSYHDAFIKYKNDKDEIKFASKTVFLGDKSTYWTKEDLDKLEKGDVNE